MGNIYSLKKVGKYSPKSAWDNDRDVYFYEEKEEGKMDIEEIKAKWDYPNADSLDWNDAKDDIDRLIKRVKELESDLKLNASMLSKQCDLAREAEERVKVLEASIKRALDDSESGNGWGPDVTVCVYLREALRGGRDSEK